jgi:homoserine O-succinyltransferase
MPVYWDTHALDEHQHNDPTLSCVLPAPALPVDAENSLRIGLINNMPDSALHATERQFASLLNDASDGVSIKFSLYALPAVPRKAAAAKHIRKTYTSIDRLWDQRLDGLIVTGAEPVMPRLDDEPYWPMLTRVMEWAQTRTHSTIWSCLAAHAAVLKLDGIARVRSQVKHFGVLECSRLTHHPLTAGLPTTFPTPHSRWNGLPEEALAAADYQVLTRTADVGVDAFVKQYGSLFVFLQGHPEYEWDSLLREYRRDVARYLRGESEVNPPLPRNYFPTATASALTALREKAAMSRSEKILAEVSKVLGHAEIAHSWRSSATGIYRNWLHFLRRAAAVDDTPRPLKVLMRAPVVNYSSLIEG